MVGVGIWCYYAYCDELFTLMLFFDFIQGVESGTLRAAGFQTSGFIISLIGYWLCMVPAAYLLAFQFNLGFIGIWLGAPLG